MKTFISYSWDSENHKDWVRKLADDLIRNGVDTTLDQYDLPLGADRFAFMESSIRKSDCILCVCTPHYVENANQRQRGVGVETSLITPQYYETYQNKQFIPIIRARENGKHLTPDYLASLIYADFTQDDIYTNQLDALLRHLYQKPKYHKPELGPIPNFDDKPRGIEFIPFIFLSGSKLIESKASEIKRFSEIGYGIGETIAKLRYGIVGCPPHPSRVLASVEAIAGLYKTAPDAPVSHANVKFPLSKLDQLRFASLASAAVFIGGSEGTFEEFTICQQLGIKPLIPIAGADGTGKILAKKLFTSPQSYFDVKISPETIKVLVNPDLDISEYKYAVEHILMAHNISPKRYLP